MRVIAVDWSGKLERAQEFIWLAEARAGELVDLRNGFTREGVIDELIAMSGADARLLVGLDFAFSFPAWWCSECGWTSPDAVWEAMDNRGEDLLKACDDPFWGRPGRRNRNPEELRFRKTDKGGAKSVFQIGGAGAVGAGSIRGMPQLLRLKESGFGIWPFDPPRVPRVFEIYPRALTGAVDKSKWTTRHAYLAAHFPEQPAALRERAAGSEDAFDAAVSAIVMSRHAEDLAELPAADDPIYGIEGRIWRPG